MVELFSFLLLAAVCIVPPVDGSVVAPFAPVGQYGGHWGVDFASIAGSPVSAPASGVVTFAGSVAGMQSITIEAVPGFKVSMSYLSGILVSSGQRITAGSLVGFSGMAHQTPSLHFSTRIDGHYVDPMGQLGCRNTDISRALRLVTPPQPYPRTRANWNSRRNIRPDSHRPSPRGGDSASRRSPRQSPVRSGR